MKIVGWWRCLYVKVLQMRGAHVSWDGDGDALVVFVVGWPRTASKAVNLRQMSRRKGQCWTGGQNSNLTDMSSQVERTLTNPVVMQLLVDSRWIRNPDFEEQARTDGAGNNPNQLHTT